MTYLLISILVLRKLRRVSIKKYFLVNSKLVQLLKYWQSDMNGNFCLHVFKKYFILHTQNFLKHILLNSNQHGKLCMTIYNIAENKVQLNDSVQWARRLKYDAWLVYGIIIRDVKFVISHTSGFITTLWKLVRYNYFISVRITFYKWYSCRVCRVCIGTNFI